MVSVSLVSFEKYELQMRKKIRNFFKSQKAKSKNFLTQFLSVKYNLRNACKLYETMDPVSGLGSEK